MFVRIKPLVRVMLTVLAAVAAASFPLLAAAETLLSLDDAIDIALEQGYDMKTNRLSLIQAEQSRLAAKYRFRTNVDMSFNLPSWTENVREVQVPNGLPVYNSLGTYRYQGTLNINQPLPTDGRITLRSRMYQSKESNYFAETKNTLKRMDFLSSFSVNLTQPLFSFNNIKANLKRAELNYERSSLTLRRNRLDVVYTVTNSFYDLYRATRSRDIAQETLNQQQMQYDTAKSKFDAGLIPEVEALRLEVELATARSQFYEAEATLERQKEAFKTVIGVELSDDIGVQTEISYGRVEVDTEEAIRIGLTNRTELREQEIAIELSKLNLKQIDAEREVSGNLSAYYDFTGRSDPTLPYGSGTRDLFDSSIDDLERRPGNRGVTMSLDIPIFDWGVNKAEVESARATLRQAEIRAEEQKKTVIMSISDAVRQLRAAENRLAVLEKSQEVAQRTYDISLERFSNGVITSLDLSQDNRSLSNAKLQYLSAYISYKLAVADLKRKTLYDFETGTLLIEGQ